MLRNWSCFSQSMILSQSYYAGSIGSLWKPELSINWHYSAISAYTTMRCHVLERHQQTICPAKDTSFCLEVPRFSWTTVGLRAFSISGPKVWNQLPLKLSKTTSTDSFKKDLKTYYFNIYLRWHCLGQYLCYYYCLIAIFFYLRVFICYSNALWAYIMSVGSTIQILLLL